ncbi:arginine--tRNA ligase [uncultured Paludibaculum sp.]|uniref:arginine--tRNA ligase n=1 Tax=uncultured Paludibaculum sp. TaxID=1765020 RepID=UPI002AAB438F|nr:arginine--tRNA ligase [uncultured Paludibaculum sp.]
MFHLAEQRLREAFTSLLKERYGVDIPVVIEQPKQSDLGELAVPVAFALARQLKKAPKVIAAEIVAALPPIPGIASVEVAGNGFLNARLDRGEYGALLLAAASQAPAPLPGKTIVEHTNINPNKAAHIGHLRNAVLGDTFVRMLRASGRKVEVQNYIDNTGVQVADVVVGFHHLEQKSVDEVKALIAAPKFDYYCWDLYARTSAYYGTHPEAVQWRRDALHAIEHGEGVIAELGHLVADAIVECHLTTMWRLGISYDVLPRESEILHLQFWATAFEQLKERKAIYLVEEGKNKGCWVMAASHFRDSAGEEAGDDDAKVIVRSNGTVTYVGKDIAYQMWKFGILGKDFHYMPLRTYPDGHVAWVATADASEAVAERPAFGGGTEVYNVIDSRQSYLQDVVVAGLRALGYADQADRSIHFSYEMVALSPRTCVELDIPLSEEDKKKSYVEVSGRKGLGVKADDLIDKLIEKAQVEVDARHAEKPAEERRRVATQIAIGALRYFLLKFTRNTVIAFDLQEALSFEGETGPYIQYAAVRASKILAKLVERGEQIPEFAEVLNSEKMARQLSSEPFWQLLLSASKSGSALNNALGSGEPAQMARYAFQLAQSFNTFYQDYPILAEKDPEKRIVLLWLAVFFQKQLQHTLENVLGIPVPEYM